MRIARIVTLSNAARDPVYVDWSNTSYEDGTSPGPLEHGVRGPGGGRPGGSVYIWPGSYDEPQEIVKPMTLRRWGDSGTVIIGQ